MGGSSPLAPWHLWGTGVSLNPIVSAIPSPENMQSGQLARINYGRPESWGFFFSLETTGAHTVSPGSTIRVATYIDLIIGVGRSQVIIPQFAFLQMTGVAATLQNQKKWTTVTQGPVLSDDAAVPFQPSIDRFVAQDIQCSARAFAYENGGGPVVGDRVSVQIETYFAPLSHIRPDWYTDAEGDENRYKGDESGGT